MKPLTDTDHNHDGNKEMVTKKNFVAEEADVETNVKSPTCFR